MLLHDHAKKVTNFLDGWQFEVMFVAPLFFLVLLIVAAAADPGAISGVLSATIAISPVWLPFFIGSFLLTSWVLYARFRFWFKQEYVLLHIQLPPEVEKSPLSMEAFFIALWNIGGETTFIDRVIKGQFRPVWSLEIASTEGRLGYYLHVRKGWRQITEARLYGQFPEAKVTEVDDYVSEIPFNLDDYSISGSEYGKSDKVPQALPIKTYVAYGLDKNPDEELKVDPITNILELLAQVGKGEHFWMQIICRGRKQDEWYGFYLKENKFIKPARDYIEKLVKSAADRAKSFAGGEVDAAKQAASRGFMLLSEGERRRVDAIERSMTKLIFECGVRVVYLAKSEKFTGVNIGAMVRFFDSVRGQDEYNALGLTNRGAIRFDYPWQDFMNIRKRTEWRHLYYRYKNRAYFFVPYDQVPVFLNTEELATLWHYPSSVIKTTGLNRIPSRVGDAPPNLPTLPS